jgi:hypothetical protein
MHAYDPAGFEAFFTAVTGAAAALAGLLFVAISINLERILKVAGLPARAAETLAMLLFVVVSSALALVPQPDAALGIELLVMTLPLAWIALRGTLRYQRENPENPLMWATSRVASTGIALLPGAFAGVSLAAHWGGGLYWLVATALLGIASAVFSAWVLLVEIIR